MQRELPVALHVTTTLMARVEADAEQPSHFWVRLQNLEKRVLASSCLSVCPSLRVEQFCFFIFMFTQPVFHQ